MKTEKDWANGTLKEVSFWRDDMSVEEYEQERTYLSENLEKLMNGTYTPLWKQK